MQFNDDVLINASIDRVWAVYTDVEHWPEWTASVRETRYTDGDTLAVGARVLIDQPKLPTATWEVSSVDTGRSWTWIASGPGVRTTAVHTLEAAGNDKTRVQQTLVQSGPLGSIIGRVYSKLTRRYLAMEASGLKQRCEDDPSA
jgi:uncharacterized protein YndB with AHSA1/START domain